MYLFFIKSVIRSMHTPWSALLWGPFIQSPDTDVVAVVVEGQGLSTNLRVCPHLLHYLPALFCAVFWNLWKMQANVKTILVSAMKPEYPQLNISWLSLSFISGHWWWWWWWWWWSNLMAKRCELNVTLRNTQCLPPASLTVPLVDSQKNTINNKCPL